MNPVSSDNLLGQTSALMMVVREMLARLPGTEVEAIRTSVEARLDSHSENSTHLGDVLLGANEMMQRLFIDRPRKFPAR